MATNPPAPGPGQGLVSKAPPIRVRRATVSTRAEGLSDAARTADASAANGVDARPSSPRHVRISDEAPRQDDGPVQTIGRRRGESISQRLQRRFEDPGRAAPAFSPIAEETPELPSTSTEPRRAHAASISSAPQPTHEHAITRQRSHTVGSYDGARPASARSVSPPPGVRVRVGSLSGRPSRSSLRTSGERPPATDLEKQEPEAADSSQGRARSATVIGRLRARTWLPPIAATQEEEDDEDHHEAHEVDLLEVVDPAVQTAATLSQTVSAIFLPPNIYATRQPVINLDDTAARRRASTAAQGRRPTVSITKPADQAATSPTVASTTQDDTVSVTESEVLDEHVKEMVEAKGKKREMLQRVWKGFVAFAKTPLGVCVCIYGFLVVFWGAGLVLILIKAIPIHNHHTYQVWVEICSQILNGLFTVTGLGLLPWRLIDWYHASIILHYAKVTWRRRAKRHLSPLEDPNDLPDPDLEKTDEPAATKEDVPEGDDGPGSTKNADQAPQFEHSALAGCTVVLNDKQLARLRQAQSKLSKSQTWYRPHATPTHHAFPIKWMVIILTLNVGNSLFQIGLCCVMWIFRYYNRPAWTTGLLIPASFLCGIFSGVFVWQIGKRTQKHDEVVKQVQDMISEEKRDEKAPLAVDPGTPMPADDKA